MFTNCDSTSGSPNVYFFTGPVTNTKFIPQLTSTPTILDVDIQFNEDRMLATVTVTASTAIGGTMGILLDGLIVPRLVHVVFGTESVPSQTGTAVVSSGPSGILPKADYTVLNYSVSSSLFPPPTILNCECSLNDANSSLVVVSGWCLEESDYVMKFNKGQDGAEREMSLTWVSSSTLHGTAPMYPSTAVGRLDWEKEYEVMRVVRRSPSEDIEIELAQLVRFTTPQEPIRIEGADSSLGDSKEKAGVVEFWGVGLSSGKGYTLKVQKESSSGVLSGGVIELVGTLTPSSGSESGRFSHTEEIFGVSAARISYGSSYAIVGIVVGGVEGVVNKKVGFSVPDEPCRLTKMTGSEFTDAEKTKMELSFETHALSANTDYSMVVESIVGEGETVHEKTLVLRTNTNGKIEPISVKLYPREDDATKLKGQLEFGTRYYVKRIEEGSTEIHIETAASTFLTPEEPIRIEGADSSLGDSEGESGSCGVLGRGESGRFSHTEEIFGVSAARISYGSSYAIVGIVVGGVEGVVNKKVGFSVPDEPCRLTKMTGSEFTDAEKTKMELSFETHALSANTDYSMVVESIVGEGETVHEKTLVLRTNTNGKIEPISVKLYPRGTTRRN
ncbi:hypothetical protein BLNAU_21186 [Blattamonas nauphoetae]|uniref:Uncharacterized protein n=1 Tax=Blattamonas nauphoetae TaxID=2049346 RepID=A0ABQ9WWK2_9EUKA|nr:hypothetical protein BLNAU_21186 [Blattamonas nauphoetae]